MTKRMAKITMALLQCADVVEVCGGSRQLIRILNRVGCVSSLDTHDCFVTHHADMKRQRSVWDDISQETFSLLLLLTTLISSKAMQLFTQVISIAAIMVQQYN